MTKKTSYEVRPVWFVSLGTWLVGRFLLLLLLVAFLACLMLYLTSGLLRIS